MGRRYCEVPQNCVVHTSDHHAVDDALPASSRKTEGGDIVGWCPRSTARERRACARADDSTAICLTSICAPASFDPPGAVEVRVQILRLHLDLLASVHLEDNPFSRASRFGGHLRRTDARERTCARMAVRKRPGIAALD